MSTARSKLGICLLFNYLWNFQKCNQVNYRCHSTVFEAPPAIYGQPRRALRSAGVPAPPFACRADSLLISTSGAPSGQRDCFEPDLRCMNEERMRPACRFGWLARTFVTQLSSPSLRQKVCGTRFSAGRRKPHASGVRSPGSDDAPTSASEFGLKGLPSPNRSCSRRCPPPHAIGQRTARGAPPHSTGASIGFGVAPRAWPIRFKQAAQG